MFLPEIIQSLLSGLLVACMAAIVACGVVVALYRAARRWAAAKWLSLSWMERGALACLCAACILFGSVKPPGGMRGAANAPVSMEDVARGYRLESVVTNDAISYAMPTDGVENVRWSRRGGRETRFALDLGDFFFPFGTGVVSRIDVLSGGMVESLPRPSLASIRAALEWASLIPGESRFWWADTAVAGRPPYQDAQAVKLLTWENVYAGRDRTGAYSAQIELREGGDFTTRSNNVERVYRRVPPFDWDGDGLENSVDPDPLAAGPDAHGTNAEWYNTVCSNIVVATPGGSGVSPLLEWREGVNSNAYYFVDVVAERGPAPVYFTGDRPSRLGDPVVMARGGETNRVPLLIGIRYAVTSDVPFTVSFTDSGFATIATNNGSRSAEIVWPLEFTFTEGFSGGSRVYTVGVVPYDPGGTFSWGMRGGASPGGLRSGGCNCISYNGSDIVLNCSEECHCCGICTALGHYCLDGAVFDVSGCECRCGFFDPGPGDPAPSPESPSLSVSFSKSVAIFEDAYQVRPGEWKPKRSTRVRLTVSASGGLRGGTLVLSSENLDKLSAVAGGAIYLPASLDLGANETFYTTCVYEGTEASDSAEDVSVDGTFTENLTGESLEGSAVLTIVNVSITEKLEAIGNPSAHRHLYGIGEDVSLAQVPATPAIQWGTTGNGSFSYNAGKMFCCPLAAEESELLAQSLGVTLPIPLSIIEPESILCDYAEFLPPAPGKPGCGMLLRLLVTPFVVSFHNLEIQEVPADLNNWQQWGSHSGYFADYAYYQYWCHTTHWGAGVWRGVDEFNSLDFDESRIGSWPQPWSTGYLSWKIPYGWRHKRSMTQACVGQIKPPSYSVWTMSTNLLEKTKHGYRVGISSSGQMFFEGALQNGN